MSERSDDMIMYLDPLEQGASLTEKAVDVHVIDGVEFIARWFHSPLDSDLMLWFDAQGGIARFQLNSGGQIVDWNAVEGLQTGLIVELEIASNSSSTKKKFEIAETIRFDSELNDGTIRDAGRVLSACTGLSVTSRLQVLGCLEDAVLRSSRVNASRARFWGRFKRWTTGA